MVENIISVFPFYFSLACEILEIHFDHSFSCFNKTTINTKVFLNIFKWKTLTTFR